MHIEKSRSEPAFNMVFRKATTSVVHIGRRPGSEPERKERDTTTGKAMFRCAVVSRKHAKILFTDTGVVRIHLLWF